jgi:hypothetical protein
MANGAGAVSSAREPRSVSILFEADDLLICTVRAPCVRPCFFSALVTQ